MGGIGMVVWLAAGGCSSLPDHRPARTRSAASSVVATQPPRDGRAPTTTTASPPTPRGTRAWRLTRPALDGQVEGYATTSSGLPGATVALRVSTGERAFRVRAYRIGAYRHAAGLLVWASRRLPGVRQPGATFADSSQRTIVAPWRTSVVVDTDGWQPGLYVFVLRTRSGWQAQVPYVVSSPSTRGRVAVVLPVTTWQAYNDWGGYSLYEAPPGDRRSWTVSFDRPYPAPGAGEMRFGAVPVVVAAERLGIPLAYLTSVDLDRRPDALVGARAFVSAGHDEYWTPAARRHVVAARDAGTNLLFLGANTAYWRVRLADTDGRPGRLVTGYRGDAAQDPAPAGRRTGLWRSMPHPRPEQTLTGMEYECFPVDAPFVVESPRWWGFAGTGVTRGTAFPHLVGVEADRVYPVPGTPHPLQVLASVRYPCRGVETSAQAAYYTTPSGAGVLDVGTLQWTCALENRCARARSRRTSRFVSRVTATVLREFARGPAGRRHPAHDNVSRFDLPTLNQVPAS
jgi:hypothetical protein